MGAKSCKAAPKGCSVQAVVESVENVRQEVVENACGTHKGHTGRDLDDQGFDIPTGVKNSKSIHYYICIYGWLE